MIPSVTARRERPGDLLALAEAELAELGDRAPGALAVVTLPGPAAPRGRGAARYFRPRGEPAAWGFGEALVLRAHGADRFAAIERAAARLWPRLVERRHAVAPAPRFYGGFAFDVGATDDDGWREFGDARFALAEVSQGPGWISLACDGPERPAQRRRALDALAARLGPDPAPARPARISELEERGVAGWAERVGEIQRAIARGECAKIVLARATVATLEAEADGAELAERLAARHPGCHGFAIQAGAACFVGASPETLVRRRGERVDCEALAGTVAVGADPEARVAALLQSVKDRGEHAVVVDALCHALAGVVVELELPRGPEVRALEHVLHLATPIGGRLRAPTHVLALAAALHPTPAVAGAPREVALAFLRRREALARGWYAGLVGWFDAAGDGELAVALRSVLLAGRAATIYGGAGIVAGSTAARELDETRWKQRAVLAELGVRA